MSRMMGVNCLTAFSMPTSISSVLVRYCLNSGMAFSGVILDLRVRRAVTSRPDLGTTAAWPLPAAPLTFWGT